MSVSSLINTRAAVHIKHIHNIYIIYIYFYIQILSTSTKLKSKFSKKNIFPKRQYVMSYLNIHPMFPLKTEVFNIYTKCPMPSTLLTLLVTHWYHQKFFKALYMTKTKTIIFCYVPLWVISFLMKLLR